MTTITIDARTVTAALPARIIVTLTDADMNEVAGIASGEIVGRLETVTDDEGAAELELDANADITPSGTYYTIHVADHAFLCTVTDEDATLAEIAVPAAALAPFLLEIDGGDASSVYEEFDGGSA